MHRARHAWMRHLDFRWMSLIRSPPGPTMSFILLAGISSVASGSSSLSDSMAKMASSFGILPSCAQWQHVSPVNLTLRGATLSGTCQQRQRQHLRHTCSLRSMVRNV